MSDSSPASLSSLPGISCILQSILHCMRFRDERAANHASRRWRVVARADLKFKSSPLQPVREVMEWKGSLSSGDRCWTPPARSTTLHSHAKIVLRDFITGRLYAALIALQCKSIGYGWLWNVFIKTRRWNHAEIMWCSEMEGIFNKIFRKLCRCD